MMTHDDIMAFVEAHRSQLLPCRSFREAAHVIRLHGTEEELNHIAKVLQHGSCQCATCVEVRGVK